MSVNVSETGTVIAAFNLSACALQRIKIVIHTNKQSLNQFEISEMLDLNPLCTFLYVEGHLLSNFTVTMRTIIKNK